LHQSIIRSLDMYRPIALLASTLLAFGAGVTHAAEPAKASGSTMAGDMAASSPAPASAPAPTPKKKEKKGGC
jgi:hypothetical protein